jgi:hypothetical protein
MSYTKYIVWSGKWIWLLTSRRANFGAATTNLDRNERSGSGIALTYKNTAVQFGNALSD